MSQMDFSKLFGGVGNSGGEEKGNKWLNALSRAVGNKPKKKDEDEEKEEKQTALGFAFKKMKELKQQPLNQVDASLVKNTEEDEDELNKKMGVKPLKLNSYLA